MGPLVASGPGRNHITSLKGEKRKSYKNWRWTRNTDLCLEKSFKVCCLAFGVNVQECEVWEIHGLSSKSLKKDNFGRKQVLQLFVEYLLYLGKRLHG